MVLINELTVEQINAALLHLQRSKDEVVGGNKGTTIQNISISNSGGGGNNVDYSGTIKNLATNIEKNKTAIEKNASDIAKLKSDFSNIEKSVEDTLQGLADNGISDLSFDPLTKQLTITTNDGDTYQTVIEQDIGYLSFDSATNKLILTTGNQSQEITLPYIKASEKGSANGVATLDENGRVPYSQLPESAMEFLGQWDASTNTPHLADGTGTNGDFYIVSAGGTVNLGTAQDPHIITFSVNDRIVYEGDIAQWVRLPAGQVSSVNGQSGEVTLTASDIEYSTGCTIKQKIDANAVQANWNETNTTSLAYIQNKPTIPASPVQSDWNVTDTTSLAYIKNKPAIPSTPTLVCCAKCNGAGVAFGSAAVCDATKFVPKRTNGYLYNPAIANYWGSSGGRYFRIKIPKGSAYWAMVALEVSLRTYGGGTDNCYGKVLIHGYWWSTAEWNQFTYSVTGSLRASNVKVYGSDKQYIYIYTNTTYTTASLDRVLLGDSITASDVSAMEIDNVSALPATYQTARLVSIVSDAYSGEAVTFAYGKEGLTSNPSCLAAWNGYELRAVSPSVVCVACAAHATCADHATSAEVTDASRADKVYYTTLAGGDNSYPLVFIHPIAGCNYVSLESDNNFYFKNCSNCLEKSYFHFHAQIAPSWRILPTPTFTCNQGSDTGTNWFLCCACIDVVHQKGQVEVWSSTNLAHGKEKIFSITLEEQVFSIKSAIFNYMCDCNGNYGGPEPAAFVVGTCKVCFGVYNRNSSTNLCKPHFLLQWWY